MSDRSRQRARIAQLVLVFIAFISLGLPDGLLGVAWPSIRHSFSKPLDALGALLMAFTSGYLTSSFLSGFAMSRIGVGWLLSISCAATGFSLLAYTLVGAWGYLVAFAVLTGLGAGAIDGGINTYVASHFGERWMHWLHASWGVGITLGPLIMTAGLEWFQTWRWGYVAVGMAQVVLGAFFLLTLSRWNQDRDSNHAHEEKRLTDFQTPLPDTLRHPRVWFSVLLFFVFSGAEATAGVWAFTLLKESRGLATQEAGLLTAAYWATFTLGRILAGLYTARLGGPALIRTCLIGMLAGALLLGWNPSPWVGLAGLIVTGFFVSPVFPGLVSGTSDRVGRKDAANTIGIQIGAAGVGAAALPGLAGVIAERHSMEIVPVYLAALVLTALTLHVTSQRLAGDRKPSPIGNPA